MYINAKCQTCKKVIGSDFYSTCSKDGIQCVKCDGPINVAYNKQLMIDVHAIYPVSFMARVKMRFEALWHAFKR